MPGGPTADTAQGESDAITFDSFSGLRNTISPERMGPRELTQATNVDVDDAGQLRRRRGYRKVLIGQFHSLYQIDRTTAIVVKDGMLSLIRGGGYQLYPLLAGIGLKPISYARIGPMLYCSSLTNSCKVYLGSVPIVRPWGLISDHNYQPGLEPAPAEWWYSPVSVPELDAGLGPVAGRLLAPPPPAAHVAYYNGRIYLAAGNMLWATMLFLYDFVDKTDGYRQYESEITGLAAVADGLYVGTRDGVYFVQGAWGEEKRVLKELGGVVPGTMMNVPGELIDPEGRRQPDMPREAMVAMSCMTTAGQVIGMPGGTTYNLTRTMYSFPTAARGASLVRLQDGMNQIITSLDSGGSPLAANARIGDFCDATIIRAVDRKPVAPPPGGDPWVPPQVIEINGASVAAQGDTITVYGVDGAELFEVKTNELFS